MLCRIYICQSSLLFFSFIIMIILLWWFLLFILSICSMLKQSYGRDTLIQLSTFTMEFIYALFYTNTRQLVYLIDFHEIFFASRQYVNKSNRNSLEFTTNFVLIPSSFWEIEVTKLSRNVSGFPKMPNLSRWKFLLVNARTRNGHANYSRDLGKNLRRNFRGNCHQITLLTMVFPSTSRWYYVSCETHDKIGYGCCCLLFDDQSYTRYNDELTLFAVLWMVVSPDWLDGMDNMDGKYLRTFVHVPFTYIENHTCLCRSLENDWKRFTLKCHSTRERFPDIFFFYWPQAFRACLLAGATSGRPCSWYIRLYTVYMVYAYWWFFMFFFFIFSICFVRVGGWIRLCGRVQCMNFAFGRNGIPALWQVSRTGWQ